MEAVLRLDAVAHGGHMVARHHDRVVFVRHGLPGELVRVAFTEYQDDSRYWRADVLGVLEPSAHRVPHIWAEADSLRAYSRGRLPVGGAEFGHISLAEQRRLKATVLREQLERLAGLETAEIAALRLDSVEGLGAPDGLGWRSRLAFAVTENGALGMHAHRSMQVFPVQDMPLAAPEIQDLGLWAKDYPGVQRVTAVAPSGGTPVVFTDADRSQNPSFSQNQNQDRGQVPMVLEKVGGRQYQLSARGFWQIHRQAPEALSTVVAEFLAARVGPGDTVVDLYAGAGLFSGLLADMVGEQGQVFSIESAAAASRNAKDNFAQTPQVKVRKGPVERLLQAKAKLLPPKGVRAVVLDPPRAGAKRKVVQQIVALQPQAVVYISCDPASFSRDLGYFQEAGWVLGALRALDLYPHTHHLETVALLLPDGRLTK